MKLKRIEDKVLISEVKRMPCCACLKAGPSDAHHIKSQGSGGNDVVSNLVSLCREHHSMLHKIGLNKFIEIFPYFKEILVIKKWSFEELRGRWINEN